MILILSKDTDMETHRIEYKRELHDDTDLEKEVIAFLNYREGGVIYIGIDVMGSTWGVANADSLLLKIKDKIKHNILPSCLGLFDVVDEIKEGKTIVKIIVASGTEKPYYKRKYGMTEKGCFIRIGTAAEPMPQRMIDALFSKRTKNSIGKIKSPRQDLTFEQLRIYYEEKDKQLGKQFKKNLELLTEDGYLNYAAYLLADENGVSIKIARYIGKDRVNLIENTEFGYCSLIKAAKNVLDKINIENEIYARITPKERIEKRLWHPVALREAIINAIVHNDYTREIPPKFEIFDDRIEITSAGSLPEFISIDEFFDGVSVPRNKELMRILKDIELVEQMGSGIPRILQAYGKDSFRFMDNFIRITFPINKEVKAALDLKLPIQVTDQVPPKYPPSTPQVSAQVIELIKILDGELFRKELQEKVYITDRKYFRKAYLDQSIQLGLVELTIPDKPNSSKQKYRLTQKGKQLNKLLEKKEQ